MHVTAALSRDLALLARALDEPGSDLASTLHELTTGARLAVGSHLGLRLTTAGDAPFTVTALEDHARPQDARSSLMVRLPGQGDDLAAGTLVLYASRAGAFVDLAADLSWLTGVDLSSCVLDQHLPLDVPAPHEPTVHATSVVDQAVGMLLGRGHLPDAARAGLDARAAADGTDRYAAAARTMAALEAGEEPPAP